jgi:hypothetical protein
MADTKKDLRGFARGAPEYWETRRIPSSPRPRQWGLSCVVPKAVPAAYAAGLPGQPHHPGSGRDKKGGSSHWTREAWGLQEHNAAATAETT